MAYQTSIPLHLLPNGIGTVNSPVALQKSILDLAATYMEAWENGDYQSIRQLASRFYGMATDILQRIEMITYFSTRDRELSDEEDSALTKTMKALAKESSPEGQAMKDAMLAQLEKDLDAGEVQAAFDSLLNGEHPIFDMALTRSRLADEETNFLCGQYASMLSFATSADYLGYLRTGLATNPGTPVLVQEGDTDRVNELNKTVEKIHDDAYKAIYDALKVDKSAAEMLALVKLYQTQLQGLFGITGALLGPYLALIPNDTDAASRVKAYRAALDLTENLNRAMVLFPYLSYLRANLSDRNLKRWLSNEQRRTDKRTFSSAVDQGDVAALQDLVNDQSIPEDSLVQVEGLVTSMEIRDDQSPPKFSTFVVLTDLESNANVQLRAHMFGLEDNGVSVGSYMRVNGFVRRDKHWLAQSETGLDIDRVNLGEIARLNWIDNVIERMKDNFQLYKDGMNMFFTLN